MFKEGEGGLFWGQFQGEGRELRFSGGETKLSQRSHKQARAVKKCHVVDG
jgi:hypothetical protein